MNPRRGSGKACVALLRGINVGGHKKVPMADLRALAEELGWRDATTYVASGNLVGRSSDPPPRAQQRLARALAERFGFPVDVIVRPAADWLRWAEGSPFADAQKARPNLLHLCLAQEPIEPTAVDALRPRSSAHERLELADGGLWIDFGDGVARSKLTPSALDKATGGPVTARNWRTVTAVAELLRERS